MASLRLRRARPEDAALLCRLKIAIYRLAYRDLLPADHLAALGPGDPHVGVAAWRKRLLDPANDIRIVEMGEPAGYSAVVPPSDTFPGAAAVLDQFYLAPAWQGGGTAGALWRAVTDPLPRPFALSAFEGNYRARRFYEARGGVITGRIAELYLRGQPFAEVVYSFAGAAPEPQPLRRTMR